MRWIALFSVLFASVLSFLDPEAGKSALRSSLDGIIQLRATRSPLVMDTSSRCTESLMEGDLGAETNLVQLFSCSTDSGPAATAGSLICRISLQGTYWLMRDSTSHTRLNVNSRQFWNFTWEQMFKFDLTAMIDKVLQTTNQKSLFYVGHSQGTMTMFAKLITEPQFASKLKKFYALVPVTAAANMKGLMPLVARNFYPTFKELYRNGSNEFPPNVGLFENLEKQYCDNPFNDFVCHNLVLAFAGPSRQMNTSRLDVFLSESPAGTSMLNAVHSAQLILTNQFKAFDYENPTLNTKRYGSAKPPHYDLSKIRNVKMNIYYSDFDFVATTKDVQSFLLKRLRPEFVKSEKLFRFNHMDFVWGINATKHLYKPIIMDMLTLLK